MNVAACACPRQVCSPGSPCRRSERSCWCGAHLVCWAMLQGEGQRLLWGSALLRCPGCGDCAGGLFAVCHCPDACSALSCTCWFDGIGEHNSSQVLSAQPWGSVGQSLHFSLLFGQRCLESSGWRWKPWFVWGRTGLWGQQGAVPTPVHSLGQP